MPQEFISMRRNFCRNHVFLWKENQKIGKSSFRNRARLWRRSAEESRGGVFCAGTLFIGLPTKKDRGLFSFSCVSVQISNDRIWAPLSQPTVKAPKRISNAVIFFPTTKRISKIWFVGLVWETPFSHFCFRGFEIFGEKNVGQVGVASKPKKMLNPSLEASLTKQGYKLVGSHSGMCVYVGLYVYAIFTCVYVYACVCVCMCIYIYRFVCRRWVWWNKAVSSWAHAVVCGCVYVYVIFTYVYTFVCVCVCVCVCVYVYTDLYVRGESDEIRL